MADDPTTEKKTKQKEKQKSPPPPPPRPPNRCSSLRSVPGPPKLIFRGRRFRRIFGVLIAR